MYFGRLYFGRCIFKDPILTGVLLKILFWQVYAFEEEVREVQEMVQRRETFPTGDTYIALVPIQKA